MPGAVRWAMELLDRMSAPARNIQKRIDLVEKTITRTDRVLKVSSGTLRTWAAAGEGSARRVENAMKRVEGRVSATRSRLDGLRGVMLGVGVAGAALGYGGVRLGSAVLGGMSTREGQLMSLQTLLKGQSAAQVKGYADWVSNFADVTPFEDNQVMSSVRQLLAAQFNSRDVQGIARITGDAASALGSDAADSAMKWEIINRALGQIKAKGRVQGDELLQLQEAGIGTDAYLKKYVGANYRQLMEQGKLSASVGISAILQGLNDAYSGSMDRMSKSYSGLISTLVSRPQRLLATMFDDGALTQAKRFVQNVVDLTDFSRPPGSQILGRLSKTGKRIMDSLFGPLADATQGQTGIDLVNRLLDKLDEYAAWWDTNGPSVLANVRGFGQGLRSAADGVMFFLRPLGWLVDKVSALTGGSGEGGVGKLLGFGAGMAAMGWLGNLLSFGMLGTVGGKAGQILIGGLKTGAGRAAQGLLTRGVIGEILTNPAGRMAGMRAAWPGIMAGVRGFGARLLPYVTRIGGFLGRLAPLAARFLPWLTRIGAAFLGLSNPIGWVITAVTLIGTGLVWAYRKFEPFRTMVDRIADGFRGLVRDTIRSFLDLPRSLGGLGGALYNVLLPPWMRAALAKIGVHVPNAQQVAGLIDGRPAAVPAAPSPTLGYGPNASINALTGVAQRLGIDPQDLLAVAFKESSLNPASVNRTSGASGLIQFMPATARALGTSVEAIRAMTPEQQAPLIERYLRQAGVKAGSNLEQIYAAVFAGSASKTGQVLYSASDGAAYRNNIGLDLDRNGEITSGEAAAAASQAWTKAAPAFAPVININVHGNATPQAVSDIGAAASSGTASAFNNYALEIGAGGAHS